MINLEKSVIYVFSILHNPFPKTNSNLNLMVKHPLIMIDHWLKRIVKILFLGSVDMAMRLDENGYYLLNP